MMQRPLIVSDNLRKVDYKGVLHDFLCGFQSLNNLYIYCCYDC
jgi:hypothetical protein